MTISQREARKMEADREELAERIGRVLPHNGVSEPQPGLHLSRFASTNEPNHTVLEPCFCVIAQGAKTLTLAGEVYRYDPAHYAVTTVGVPIIAEIIDATTDGSSVTRRPRYGRAAEASMISAMMGTPTVVTA